MLAEDNRDFTPIEKLLRNVNDYINGEPEPVFTTHNPSRTFKLIDDYSFYVRMERVLRKNHPELVIFKKFRGILKEVNNHLKGLEEEYTVWTAMDERW
jgi:hypothetical protein